MQHFSLERIVALSIAHNVAREVRGIVAMSAIAVIDYSVLSVDVDMEYTVTYTMR
jgi:hypothetical protein